ncbi:hypothetical protein [Nonomuraea antri]|nr:hypothetical protein [Nonomuraea antri]
MVERNVWLQLDEFQRLGLALAKQLLVELGGLEQEVIPLSSVS